MTQKEIAERLRKLIDGTSNGIAISEHVNRLANELDPPLPEPGTVVWWRGEYFGASTDWELGQAAPEGVYHFGYEKMLPWHEVEWRPARILAPDEVAVKIPPVSEWPHDVKSIVQRMIPNPDKTSSTIITREEAERMQRDD